MSTGRPLSEAMVSGSLLSHVPPSSSGAGMTVGSWVMSPLRSDAGVVPEGDEHWPAPQRGDGERLTVEPRAALELRRGYDGGFLGHVATQIGCRCSPRRR